MTALSWNSERREILNLVQGTKIVEQDQYRSPQVGGDDIYSAED
jgi:hypothetical protein